MSYTKTLGRGRYGRGKSMTGYIGNNCDNCECNNEMILSFNSSDGEYSSVNLCKNCIMNFIDEYPKLKPNKKCQDCEEYFDELISKNITHSTPGGIKTEKFEFCKKCLTNYNKDVKKSYSEIVSINH